MNLKARDAKDAKRWEIAFQFQVQVHVFWIFSSQLLKVSSLMIPSHQRFKAKHEHPTCDWIRCLEGELCSTFSKMPQVWIVVGCCKKASRVPRKACRLKSQTLDGDKHFLNVFSVWQAIWWTMSAVQSVSEVCSWETPVWSLPLLQDSERRGLLLWNSSETTRESGRRTRVSPQSYSSSSLTHQIWFQKMYVLLLAEIK